MVISLESDLRDEKSDDVSKNHINCGDSSSSAKLAVLKQEETTRSAPKKHALSERNRRKRINQHYDSLRRFFPHLVKTDKASVLLETVRHLKELKNMVADVVSSQEDVDRSPRKRVGESFLIPDENDQVSVTYYDNTTIQAIICCDDRPDLNQDLMKAILSVHGKAVKAEMARVCGRTIVDVVVEWLECGDIEVDVELFRRALKGVVENQIEFIGQGSSRPEAIGFVNCGGPNITEVGLGYVID